MKGLLSNLVTIARGRNEASRNSMPQASEQAEVGSASVPEGTLVFAIGDVHGRADLLKTLLTFIGGHSESGNAKTVVIGLGDYVDRGPDSAGAIDALCDFRRHNNIELVWLRGNHEAMFANFLEAPNRIGPEWLEQGGLETIRSYGCDVGRRPYDFDKVRDDMARRLPIHHIRFLESLRSSLTIGDFFFCHAGVRPNIALTSQSERDLMWIRSGFADRDAPFAKVIIHGHTPVATPDVRTHRINIDTGAYLSGVLTCLAIDSKSIGFIQSTIDGVRRIPLVH
jgi:serine/threonine protein phosphatase 1